MQPLAAGPGLQPILIPPPPSYPTPPIPYYLSPCAATEVKDCPSGSSMTWKWRGEFHLRRKEFDLAVEAFTKALQEAETKEDLGLIKDSLKELGRVFLEKEQWAFAAKIFNGAYAISVKKEQACAVTLAFMAEVERRFLDKFFKVRKPIDPKVYLQRRQKLLVQRQELKVKIPQTTPAQIMRDFTQEISLFLNEILKSGFALFGKPPCEYTVMGLGSLARKEMSPYSDLEFALLVENSLPANIAYFRKMVQWLELQIIHLGETPINILQGGYESPIVRGFSFDDGGNTPLGKQGYVELIKTPEELAKFQLERFYQEDLILSNVLRGAENVVGSEPLYQRYLKAIQAILNAKS
ncbi:MAG: DUF294 nucleotidyltransferase-like domain-containing protein, partial [Parachlamydia sp.]|nr:DUF294 nucleotidyltransferase-like domain-containing protein [Parachlamydia sp.]